MLTLLTTSTIRFGYKHSFDYKHSFMKPHIVVAPYPAQGHLPPLIYLSRKLAAQGFQVTLVNFSSVHDTVSKQWQDIAGQEIRLAKVEFGIHIPAGVDSAALEDMNHFAESFDQVQVPFEELLRGIQPSPCCVISDYFLPWAIHVTKKLGIPAAAYFPGTAAYSSVHHHVDLLFQNGDAGPTSAGRKHKVLDYIPGVEGLQVKDLPVYLFESRDAPILDKHLLCFPDRMKDCEWVLVNSMEELEPKTFSALRAVLGNKNFVPIGPLFSLNGGGSGASTSSLRSEETQCLEWLDQQPESSVLYISFGSITVLKEEIMEELAAGLEASGVAFLWVVRLGSQPKFLQEFINKTREQGLVVAWTPQVRVLAHRSTGGFLSHCGWNSTFESICHGVPILGWPCHSEQSINCKMVSEDWKFGERFGEEMECVSRNEVAKKIRGFMNLENTNEVRPRVQAFKQVAKLALSEGGTSFTNLHRFMEAMAKKTE